MFTSCSTNSFDMSWVSQVLNYSNIPSSHHIREQTECVKYAMVLSHCNTMQKYKICRKMNQPYIYEIHIFALRWRNEIERSSQLKKIQAHMGFEPMTSAIPVQRSTNWANKPTESWSWPAPSWLVSSVGRALHRYRRGHGFKSRTGLNFFQVLFSTTSSVVFLAARIS